MRSPETPTTTIAQLQHNGTLKQSEAKAPEQGRAQAPQGAGQPPKSRPPAQGQAGLPVRLSKFSKDPHIDTGIPQKHLEHPEVSIEHGQTQPTKNTRLMTPFKQSPVPHRSHPYPQTLPLLRSIPRSPRLQQVRSSRLPSEPLRRWRPRHPQLRAATTHHTYHPRWKGLRPMAPA